MAENKTHFTKEHPLWVYYLLTFGVAWAMAVPILALGLSKREASLLYILASWTPSLSAIVVLAMGSGRKAVRELLGRCIQWRVHPLAHLIAFAPMIIAILTIVTYLALGGQRLDPSPYPTVWVILAEIPFTLLFGPVSEELGWRGLALPRMQAKYNALTAALLIGVIWWLWHFPVWLAPGSQRGTLTTFALFLIHNLCISIVLTSVYNVSNGSLLLVIAGHFWTNFGSYSFGIVPLEQYYRWSLPFWIAAVLLIVIRGKPKHLDFGLGAAP